MIQIVTDSAADFEPEELQGLALPCVPLSVNFGNKEYQENVNLSKAEFYHMLEQADEIPRTSQPSPQAFISALRKIKEAGDEAVVITLSSGLSGTYQSALLAKEILGYEDCYVVDSLTATAGERILVNYALELRFAGKSAKDIAEKLEMLRSRVTLYACMDTLKYLHKGGRLSETSYIIGSFANIKPILHVTEDGRPEIPAKVMGVRRGIRYLCERLAVKEADTAFPVYVMYTHNAENGTLLAKALRDYGVMIPESHIVNVGAVIGTHIGPNAFGLVYIEKENPSMSRCI